MRIYLARPISGRTADEVFEYYDKTARMLRGWGFEVLSPMVGKEYLRTEKRFVAKDYRHPISTNHAIIERDRWMVKLADIVYVNLLGAKDISIGCMMELAWAHDNGKHSIVVMGPRNVHQHAFVLEAADIVFIDSGQVEQYLKGLVQSPEDQPLTHRQLEQIISGAL